MLEQLPAEIIIQIASHLKFKEKVNLMATCSWFQEIISKNNLYGQLKIRCGLYENNAPKLELCKKQVRNLDLECDANTVLLQVESCPNLKELTWRFPRDDQQVQVNETNAKHWQKITKFEEYHREQNLSKKIMENGGFIHLTELMVDFGVNLYTDKIDVSPLINELKQAPKLKMLDLSWGKMSHINLQDLHRNAPHLKALHLTGMELIMTDETIGEKISACGLTDLKMSRMKTGHWLEKMAVAVDYVDLQQLKIMKIFGDFHEAATELTKFVAGCPKLTSYYVDFDDQSTFGLTRVSLRRYTPGILKAMDANLINLKKIELYESGAHHLLNSNQKDSLESIVINNHLKEYSINKPKEVHPELEESTSFKQFLEKILKFFETGKSEPIVRNDRPNDKPQESIKLGGIYPKLAEFTNLKHLEISEVFSHPLYDFLHALKNLETLKLHYCSPQLASKNIEIPDDFKHDHLKNLTLGRFKFKKGNQHMAFLSKSCPALSNLSIINSCQDIDEVFDMDFSEHNFTSFTLKPETEYPVEYSRQAYFNVEDGQGKFGWFKWKDSLVYCPTLPVPSPYFSIKLKSCGRIIIGDANVRLI